MFLEKLKDWYGEYLVSFYPIYMGKNVYYYMVETDGEIEFARIFKIGNRVEISIDKKFPITENRFELLTNITLFAMGVQKWSFD